MSLELQDERKTYVRPQDRHQCTNADNDCGGTGTHLPGEGECYPQTSLRYRRGIFAGACTALIVGLLMIVGSGPYRNEFFAPGPLSGVHAQVLKEQRSDRCATCHGAGDKSLGSWIRDAVSMGNHIPLSQSQLCMDCHDKNLVNEFAMHAHSMDPVALAKLTESASVNLGGVRLAELNLPAPTDSGGQLACAACHREHHGADFNLTRLTDQQCQTCHANYIHSFQDNHPEFVDWPFASRSKIAFDHVAHGLKHFAEKNQSFDCRRCHVDDPTGSVKLVASFEESCASCHAEQITESASSGWTFFSLPMIDKTAIAEAGLSIGQWPEECDGDFDGQLPATMKLLLAFEPAVADVFARRGPNFEFSDLDPQNQRDIADATTIVWAIKQLLFDLSIDGRAGIQRRLEKSLRSSIEPQQILELSSGLHPSIFLQAAHQWLPNLPDEIRQRRSTNTAIESSMSTTSAPDSTVTKLDPSVEPEGTNPAASAQDESQSDGTKLADNPLAKLRSSLSASSSVEQPSKEKTSNEQAKRLPNISNAQTTADQRQTENVIANDFTTILAENPLKALRKQKPDVRWTIPPGPYFDAESPPKYQFREFSTENRAQNPDKQEPPKAPLISRPSASRSIDQPKLVANEDSGWHRDDQAFTISYRLTGHADPVMKGWNEIAFKTSENEAVSLSNLMANMNSDSFIGNCRKCHTVDRRVDGWLNVNWQPSYRETQLRSFTRFSHRPHDIQTSLQDCTSCHQLDEQMSNAHTFSSFDRRGFVSNFAPISKANCANCHRPGGASHGCVDCHNYHVGSTVLNNW